MKLDGNKLWFPYRLMIVTEGDIIWPNCAVIVQVGQGVYLTSPQEVLARRRATLSV